MSEMNALRNAADEDNLASRRAGMLEAESAGRSSGAQPASPLVSIIMPVYNTPLEHVRRAIGSVANQTHENLEILIVIDGSEEGYCLEVRSLCGNDVRIHVQRIDHAGVSAARNYGIEHARGEYIMFIDSDDEMPPYTVEHALAVLLDNDLDIAYGAVELRMENAIRLLCPSFEPGTDLRILEGEAIKDLEDYFFANETPKSSSFLKSLQHGTVAQIMPARLVRGVVFDTDIAFMEDTIFNANLVAKAKRVGLVNEVWYIYYQNSYSACNNLGIGGAFLAHVDAISKYSGISEHSDNNIYVQICHYFFQALENESRRGYKGRLKRIRKILKEPACAEAFVNVQVDEFDISKKRRINYWLCRKRWALPIYLFYSLRAVGQRARGESPQSW